MKLTAYRVSDKPEKIDKRNRTWQVAELTRGGIYLKTSADGGFKRMPGLIENSVT